MTELLARGTSIPQEQAVAEALRVKAVTDEVR